MPTEEVWVWPVYPPLVPSIPPCLAECLTHDRWLFESQRERKWAQMFANQQKVFTFKAYAQLRFSLKPFQFKEKCARYPWNRRGNEQMIGKNWNSGWAEGGGELLPFSEPVVRSRPWLRALPLACPRNLKAETFPTKKFVSLLLSPWEPGLTASMIVLDLMK